MIKKTIPFSDTRRFNNLITDYISGNPDLKPYYNYSPVPGSFETAINDRKHLVYNRELLKEVLLKQYGTLLNDKNSSAVRVKNSIELLSKQDSYTVTTGHQLNIFTGPLYSAYKIATTIKLAIELSGQHKNYNILPVFWMATEDHDIEEINHAWVNGEKLVWKSDSRGAAGKLNPGSLDELTNRLKTILGDKFSDITFFEEAYLNSATLAEATRKIIHHLFGEYGLIIIDGDDAELKKLFIPVMKDDLLDHTAYNAVLKTTEKFKSKYNKQVQPREINLFYLLPGQRERIIKEKNGDYIINNSELKFSREQMLSELENFPEKFSPNVVLRTVYQEKILPNLAYIGGPGEINYWLQYKEMFESFKIPFPVLILRNCMLIIESATYSKMNKNNILIPDLFEEVNSVVNRLISNDENKINADQFIASVNSIYEEPTRLITTVDKSLIPAIEGEKQRIIKGFAALEEKYIRALKRKNEAIVNQVKNINEKLFPDGGLQERHENIIPYYIKKGKIFIDEIIQNTNPFTKEFIILIDEEHKNELL